MTKLPEICVICGRDLLATNVWHIHHHDVAFCAEHLQPTIPDEDLQIVRAIAKKGTDHPEWFPEHRKNIGLKSVLAYYDTTRRYKEWIF